MMSGELAELHPVQKNRSYDQHRHETDCDDGDSGLGLFVQNCTGFCVVAELKSLLNCLGLTS
jgi:hypothetical protein